MGCTPKVPEGHLPGAQPSARKFASQRALRGSLRGSAGVSPRALRGSAGVRGIFRGFFFGVVAFREGLNKQGKGNTLSKNGFSSSSGAHLKPVTLKPVSRIFRIFRVFASAFSAFSAFSARLLCGVSNPCFCRVRGAFRIFRIFAVSGSNR